MKVLEQQLEHEHEERLNFVREKHELETKLMNLKEFASRSADAEQVCNIANLIIITKDICKIPETGHNLGLLFERLFQILI